MMNPTLPANPSQVLQRYGHALDRLELVTRARGPAAAAGRRPGSAAGNSVDFADYRKYHYGDDVRAVDWSIYARLRKLFLRQYRAEADLAVHLLLDVSGSMSVGSRPKSEFARTLAAILAYVGLGRQDRVGLATFAGDLIHYIPPERGRHQLFYLMRSLDGLQSGGASDFDRSFRSYAARASTRGLLVVLSDCFSPGGYETALRCLAFAGFEVVVVRILAQEEVDPEIEDEVELQDAEQADRPGSVVSTTVVSSAAVAPYQQALAAYSAALASFCLHEGYRYAETTTALSFEELTLRLLRAGILGH